MSDIPPGHLERLDDEFEEMLRIEAAQGARAEPPKLEPTRIRLNCHKCGPTLVLSTKCAVRGSIFCPTCSSGWLEGVSLGYPPGAAPSQPLGHRSAFGEAFAPRRGQATLL